MEQEVRLQLLGDAARGWVWGPLPRCPFPRARICSLDVVDKDKWDPCDTRFRLISNYAKGGVFSVNDGCFTPRLIALYARGCHVRDSLAHLGRAAYCRAYDVPACYRNQSWAEEFWPLFVYELLGEFWVDVRHGFGLKASEWAWQCILAILLWRMRSLHGWAPNAIVDNVFCIGPEHEANAMADSFVAQCAMVGVPLHEPQRGKVFNAVGWDWDVSGEFHIMSCPLKKYTVYVALTAKWASLPTFSLRQVKKMLGLLVFLSAGFRVAEPDIIVMFAFLKKAEHVVIRERRSRDEEWIVPSARIRSILAF